MVKLFSKTLIFLVMVFFITLSTSWADYIADITYDYTDNGSDNYTFNFTVHNNSTGADTGGLDWFLIEFDADVTEDANGDKFQTYSNINFLSANSWDNEFDDPDPGYGGTPAYITADDSAYYGSGGGGIAQGASLAGFTVNFDYSGALLPTEQLFTWYVAFGTDGEGIPAWEDEGITRYLPDNNNPVPEPATMVLFGLGLLGLAGVSRKK